MNGRSQFGRESKEDKKGAAAPQLVAWRLLELYKWRVKRCAWEKCERLGRCFVIHKKSTYLAPNTPRSDSQPAFFTFDRGPLAESCTYLSYGSLREVAAQPTFPFSPSNDPSNRMQCHRHDSQPGIIRW